MEWHRRVARIYGAVVVGAIASNLFITPPSLADDTLPTNTEKVTQSWQLVSDDQQPILETAEGDLLYTAQTNAQANEDASDYQQWLAESVMPLLDQENPERPVSREEFVFVLEAIAARYGQVVREESALVRNYCEIHGNAAGYLEGRIASLSSESDQLIRAARSMTNHAERRSPLRARWGRKQSEVQQSDIQQRKGTQDLNKQQSDFQIEQPNAKPDSTQAEERPDTPSPNTFSPPSDWPSDILHRPGELAYSVQLVYALFGDVSFEDGTFRPEQAVTQGALIDYFSRPETAFARNLYFVDIDWVRQNDISLEGAAAGLSVILEDVAEMRLLIDDLRDAISSSKDNPHRNKSHGRSYDRAVQQMPHSLISQNTSIPSITSITEIPNVSPADSVYAPLQVLVEDWGIDMIQADGNFNGEAALTRGEFARYLEPIFSVNTLSSHLVSEPCARAGDHYAELQTEVHDTRLALQQALDAISNP